MLRTILCLFVIGGVISVQGLQTVLSFNSPNNMYFLDSGESITGFEAITEDGEMQPFFTQTVLDQLSACGMKSMILTPPDPHYIYFIQTLPRNISLYLYSKAYMDSFQNENRPMEEDQMQIDCMIKVLNPTSKYISTSIFIRPHKYSFLYIFIAVSVFATVMSI